MNIILCTDLLFSTKITGTAKALAQTYLVVRTLEKLEQALAQVPAEARLIVDLNTTSVDPVAAVAQARAQVPSLRIVAFVSHVQAELAAAARAAGADRVLARSAFVNELPTLLSGSGV